jgi:hypothetical protein
MACRPTAGGCFIAVQGHQLAQVEGAAWSLPLLIGSGNGRQDARPCFARGPVALLRSRALISDHLAMGLIFFVLGGAAGIPAYRRSRDGG